ncbi:MAG TPA: 5-(carboxyamino)imidazole ribonucleotide mutase [Candidatus Omnitrophica bacterium]|nr:5-(carboxyamino)imidazole ribonucleotide mutase [Candidatus Omnitrophota bacterium]HCI44613.1 5-(carboxyamino)imidazole ribonucleotide mutase [Candidatus Omnitrophota bacterium]
MSKIQVAIMMGSQSDLPVMEEAANILKDFGVGYEIKVLSAHRTPKETTEYAEQLQAKGFQAVICGAGVSAALAGVVSAHTDIPVIGVPIDSSPLNGMDALLSTVQMPPGVPVAAMAVGKAGAKNAALFALRIIALRDKGIVEKLAQFKEQQRRKILDTKLTDKRD